MFQKQILMSLINATGHLSPSQAKRIVENLRLDQIEALISKLKAASTHADEKLKSWLQYLSLEENGLIDQLIERGWWR